MLASMAISQPAASVAEENARLKEELSRMQVMVMQYAQVVLDQRMRIPTTTATERQQIPSNIMSLRKAIGAAQTAGAVLWRTPGSRPQSSCNGTSHHAPPPPMANGSSMPPSQAVQSELARLRMQVEQLSGQCRSQHEEISASRRVLAEVTGQVSAARETTQAAGRWRERV